MPGKIRRKDLRHIQRDTTRFLEPQAEGDVGIYESLEFVRREMKYALNLFSEHPEWPVINVTGKSIEEIASDILSLSSQKLKHHRT